MPWNDLASNQMVSYTDAQTSPFSLKPGQSSVTSNQCMTKANILQKYNVTISGYADNQLVPKSDWVADTYYMVTSSLGSVNPADACSVPGGLINTFYVQISTNRVFNDSALTDPLTGFTLWFTFSNLNVVQIDNDGYIIGYYYDCIF